jgi:hypothetical protein
MTTLENQPANIDVPLRNVQPVTRSAKQGELLDAGDSPLVSDVTALSGKPVDLGNAGGTATEGRAMTATKELKRDAAEPADAMSRWLVGGERHLRLYPRTAALICFGLGIVVDRIIHWL